MEAPRSRFFDEFASIDRRLHRLPHWTQGEAGCFITWRLGDSLPSGLLRKWQGERDAWLRHHPEPRGSETESEYHERFSRRTDQWLDQGIGACVLRQAQHAAIVASALRHFDRMRYDLDAFVVMPNHVHVLIFPRAPNLIPDIVKSWKTYTARQINLALGRTGALWQEEYWDRLIRSEEHYVTCRIYIRDNPRLAGVKQGEFIHFERRSR